MEHPFRSAAIGGFNKQDVLDFLEAQSKQAAQAQQEVQSRLEESQRQEESLRRQVDELTGRLDSAEQARDGLGAELELAREASAEDRREIERLTAELERACRERDEARAALEEARPGAQAYAELKERTAGVELEAHRRAQTIQAKAEEDARQTRRRMEQWLKRVEREYDALCTQVETTVSHAASELDKAGRDLDRLKELMSSQDSALEGVRKAYGETDPARPEAPMPIEE